MAAIKAREAACAPLLKPMGGDPFKALALALADPPYATKTESVKVASCELVCRALLMIKEAEIETALDSLSLDECDVLMKCATPPAILPAGIPAVCAGAPLPLNGNHEEALFSVQSTPRTPGVADISTALLGWMVRSRLTTPRCSSGTRPC